MVPKKHHHMQPERWANITPWVSTRLADKALRWQDDLGLRRGFWGRPLPSRGTQQAK